MSPAPQVFLDDIADKPPVMDDGKLVLVEVKKSEIRIGKDSGNPYIAIQVEVKDDEEDEGTTMFDNLMLPLEMEQGENPKAYRKRMDRRCWRLKGACKAFGVNPTGAVPQDELAEMFIARQAWAATKIESDDRGDRNTITAFYHLNEKPA